MKIQREDGIDEKGRKATDLTAPDGEMIRVGDLNIGKFFSEEDLQFLTECCQGLTPPAVYQGLVATLFKQEAIAQIAAQQARDIRMLMGRFLRITREQAGLTIQQLCVRCGLNRNTVASIESGNKTPSDLALMKLFHSYGWKYPGMPNLSNAYPVKAMFRESIRLPTKVVDAMSTDDDKQT